MDNLAITFFDKRRAEVPSILYVKLDLIMKTAYMKIPAIKHIQEFITINLDIILVLSDNN